MYYKKTFTMKYIRKKWNIVITRGLVISIYIHIISNIVNSVKYLIYLISALSFDEC